MAYAELKRGDARKDCRVQYLVTLNEVLFTAFLLILVIKEADSMHKIRNNRILFLLSKGGGCHGVLAP